VRFKLLCVNIQKLKQLDERETYWKQYYLDLVEGDWNKVLFCELYDNGGGPRSEEIKKKISESNKGKIVSQETRDKKRLSMLGKKMSISLIITPVPSDFLIVI